MFLRQEKGFRFAFEFFISKTICKVTVQPEYFIEFAVCSQIKPRTQTFPGISRHPIVPWPKLVITSIDITGCDKIQCLGKSLEYRCVYQCINHSNDGFLIL